MNYSNAKDAKAAGAKTYFTGVACKNGHLSPRFAGNRECVECDRLRKGAKKALKMASVMIPEVVVVPVKTVRVVTFKAPRFNRRGQYIMNRPEIASDRVVMV